MSQKQSYPIQCPTCGAAGEAELFDAVNVAAEPALRDQLMSNQLNLVRCAACEFEFRVDKPLLYNDPRLGVMLYLIPTADDQQMEGERQFRDHMAQMSAAMPEDMDLPQVHLVFSRPELIERVFLLEAELQPRVVEYVKYSIYAQNLDQLEPATKRLLFNAEDSNEESLCFVVQDLESKQLETVLQYSRQAYQGLCEMFDKDDQTASLLEMFPGPTISARSLLLRESSLQE